MSLTSAATFTFYIQTWDEYYTQTLTLGIVSGPVEGILTLCIVYAVTAYIGGGSFWQQSMLESIGVEKQSAIPELIYNLSWNEWWIFYGGVVLVFNTLSRYLRALHWPPNITNILTSIQHVLSVRKEQKKSLDQPLYGLIPYLVTWTFVPSYLYLQPVILNHHLIPFVFYCGLINAYAVGQIIIKHLTKDSHFPMYNILTLPLALAVFDSMGPYLGAWPSVLGYGTYQIAFLFSCVGLGLGVYGSFVVSLAPVPTKCLSANVILTDFAQYDIITTICDYLDIWCLTIKHPINEKGEQKKLK